ncbi:MAG TPA: hypothetical protein VHO24_11170 [Opitutaceae bacterium]|nr:hypothetical protein [Opitutaceae bacterium]
MADRLQELLQQRALIKEHLEWLDAEIAASTGGQPPPAAPSTTSRAVFPPRAPVEPLPPAHRTPVARGNPAPARPVGTPDADALLAKLAAEEKAAPLPSKKGCWTIFWVMLVVFLGGVFGVWYFFRR